MAGARAEALAPVDQRREVGGLAATGATLTTRSILEPFAALVVIQRAAAWRADAAYTRGVRVGRLTF